MVKIPDILTSGGEEEHVRGAKMQPLTVIDRSGQRLVSAANLLIGISAGAKSGCGFSLSRPREGRLLPSERDAKGGIFFENFCAGEGSRTHTHEALDPKSSLSTNFNTPAVPLGKKFINFCIGPTFGSCRIYDRKDCKCMYYF